MLMIYRYPALSNSKRKSLLNKLQPFASKNNVRIVNLDAEFCFYTKPSHHLEQLEWILGEPFGNQRISRSTFLKNSSPKECVIEIGPRLNFTTPFSTNAISICHSIGLTDVDRIEMSIRYYIQLQIGEEISQNLKSLFTEQLHDKMTECEYVTPLETFTLSTQPQPWYEVDVLKEGRKALDKVNVDLGLAMDEWDINYYTELFRNQIKRNPTSVECFDLAQSNSEHSRHWFFKGKIFIDGKEQSDSLLNLVMNTQDHSNKNNVIKFSDNSSAIKGARIPVILPTEPRKTSHYVKVDATRHVIFTAETHNFPTAVSPFSGAATGTGGRIRDVQAAGRGAHVIAGIAGYCVGNLHLPDYPLPWEKPVEYPSNFAHPRKVIIEASNGASDYGNKFGEPVIAGFARSCGLMHDGRREWVKPVMFSAGIGSIDKEQITKLKPTKGMKVVKIGGPVYRIGVGGGAASSVQVQGDNAEELDFGAVQRGDAEMEQKLNRVIRACVEMGSTNPICSIHDQGAGGNGNVLKEIVDPEGAVIYTDGFHLGDLTINTLELWGAEYQESNAILIRSDDKSVLEDICQRERCPVSFVGVITGDKKITLVDNSENLGESAKPVDLDLELVLGKMPQKEFHFNQIVHPCKPLELPTDLKCSEALDLVLRLPSVASKRYLTNKVDRCVTGLIAQQQCVGPLHTPLADVAVVALSYFDTVGSACAVGEQPVKGLVDCKVGARMSVAEAVTNLMFAPITTLQDVKCSANWMWAAKLPGEGAALYSACVAMTDSMKELGIAIDGGKDSLSMAARVGNETVKSPGMLVISAYAVCPDITNVITPDFKCPNGKGCVLLVQLNSKKFRIGGTAFAQVMGQVGDDAPDLDDASILRNAFEVTQKLIREKKIKSGHDISDGGVIGCLLEMTFAGNCSLEIKMNTHTDETDNEKILAFLFNEEVGWVLETEEAVVAEITKLYAACDVCCQLVGYTTNQQQGADAHVLIEIDNIVCIKEKMVTLRTVWEETSFQLELQQTNTECAIQEKETLKTRRSPPYCWPGEFKSSLSPCTFTSPPKVAIIREEGTNGDREMSAAFMQVGFQVWDVTMSDIISGQSSLDRFQGIVFPGGFSYADVLGSAKGWAAAMQFNDNFYSQLKKFRSRPNSFSLGICNGCQLMALLGWISPDHNSEIETPGVLLKHNNSERFECRFTTVRIEESSSIMLQNLAGAVLGVWVAHGEGHFHFKNDAIKIKTEESHLVPIRYVDDNAQPTTTYPYNPNGSPDGIAAICSEDGRHLAIMPHPERCIFPWQWPWVPEEWITNMSWSPWLKMFENAFNWCLQH